MWSGGLPRRRGGSTCGFQAMTGVGMAQANFVLLEDRGILAVSGPDRQNFLQGLVSNDVMRVVPERAGYAALLTAQGKYLHDFVMIECQDAIWIDAERERLTDLRRRLALYRLRAKVEIAERPDLAVAAVFGDDAANLFDLPEEARFRAAGSECSSGFRRTWLRPD